jgi:hypothetical protein
MTQEEAKITNSSRDCAERIWDYLQDFTSGKGFTEVDFIERQIDRQMEEAVAECDRLRGENRALREALREIWFAPVSDGVVDLRQAARRALLSTKEAPK